MKSEHEDLDGLDVVYMSVEAHLFTHIVDIVHRTFGGKDRTSFTLSPPSTFPMPPETQAEGRGAKGNDPHMYAP